MRKTVVCLSLLVSFLLLSQISGVVLADEEDNHDTHEEADDMSLCTSAIFLLVLVFIVVMLIILGFSRKEKKA
jgi:cell division protein FtsW (lipid II flippase)